MMSYDRLLEIKNLDFSDKKALVIGAGFIGKEYCKALRYLGVNNITVITRTKDSALRCQGEYECQASSGGYKEVMPQLKHTFDLVVVATPIEELITAADESIRCGNRNILVEKPVSLYSSILKEWRKNIPDGVRIRAAYNRLLYPSLWKLKDIIAKNKENMTSCRYSFTEWAHAINFCNNTPDCYQRWGIANSLHVISMAHSLIGMPDELSAKRYGALDWHPHGAQFLGTGVTEKKIPFLYHADWGSAGRWSIEVMTDSACYRMIPLEVLSRCPKGSVEWEPIEVRFPFPECKAGIAEEIAVMLKPALEDPFGLPDLERTVIFTELAEKIFGYDPSLSTCMSKDLTDEKVFNL